MWFDRNNVAVEELGFILENAGIGVVARGITDIDLEQVAERVAERLKKELRVTIIDGAAHSSIPNVVIASDIESAVEWRSMPEFAGGIIVFVQEEVEKLHSLGDLDTVTVRDLSRRLLSLAAEKLSYNQPQQRFWNALRNTVDTFPLEMLESFVQAVNDDPSNIQAISENLWRLGLLRDDALLENDHNPVERLARNRNLILEMGRLSENSRRRMSNVLRKAIGEEQRRLHNAFIALKEFYRRGTSQALRELDISTVEQLIQSGSPLKNPLPPSPPPDSNEGEPSNETAPQQRPLRGHELEEEVATYAVSSDEEAQDALRELAILLRQKFQDPQSTDIEVLIPGAFENRVVQVDNPQTDLRTFIGYFVASDRWGGLLHTTCHDFRDAVRRALPEDTEPYDPADPTQGVAGQSLFSLLRAFDRYLPSGIAFSPVLDRFISFRQLLLPELDLLLVNPLVLFGGSPEMREALNGYLEAYTELLSIYSKNEATLYGHDANAMRFIACELIRLEVIHIRTPKEWKAMLTPLHPFHLWRFREIFNAIHSAHPLSEDAQRQLAEALPKLPHLLHFLVISPEVTKDEDVALPQAGTFGLLPTYENRTNRYLGADGIDFITDLLHRWLTDAPYSKTQIRLGLVDVPDFPAALHAASAFLFRNRDVQLVVDAYFTRGQNPTGDLTFLNYEGRDYEIGDLLQSGRLMIHLYHRSSISEVVSSQ